MFNSNYSSISYTIFDIQFRSVSVENCLTGGDTLRISAISVHRWKQQSLDYQYHLENHTIICLFCWNYTTRQTDRQRDGQTGVHLLLCSAEL